MFLIYFSRINFECRKSGIRKNRRPALNLGVQYRYLDEKKKSCGKKTKEDIEVVYPDLILDGDGMVKDDPIHIFVPDIFKGISFTRDPTCLGGIRQFLKMHLPP